MTMYRARALSDRMLQITGEQAPALMAGEFCILEIHESRSFKSHKHQFAWVKTAWLNLPEEAQGVPWCATPETLRKYALIRCGYANGYTIDCATPESAKSMRAALLRAEVKAEGWAIGQISGSVLTIWTAKSQSVKEMGAKDFQESKTAILNFIANLIGTTPEELQRAAQQ